MGEFWSEVVSSGIKFIIYAALAFAGVLLGMKLRMVKNKSVQSQESN